MDRILLYQNCKEKDAKSRVNYKIKESKKRVVRKIKNPKDFSLGFRSEREI